VAFGSGEVVFFGAESLLRAEGRFACRSGVGSESTRPVGCAIQEENPVYRAAVAILTCLALALTSIGPVRAQVVQDPQIRTTVVDPPNAIRYTLDEVANELYIINQKRVQIYDASTGAYKRGWGGHGMPLSEIENGPIAGYKWTGGPPPEEKNFVPTLHFVEISKDRRVYIGERGQNRIQVFTTEGKWLQDIYVSPNSPAQRGGCGGLDAGIKAPPVQIVGTFTQSICGTTYKMIISKDPQQKYLFVADAHNDVVWTVERQSGKTLGYFGGSGRLAGQMTFPNAIGIDTFGNVYVGEVDFGKRIQRFAPVLTGAR
jgi:hypothetical protein